MGTPTAPLAPPRILLLRIELGWITPVIYRSELVPETVTLGRLHRPIRAVTGWQDYHLHEFEIGGQRYGAPDPDRDDPGSVLPEVRARLARCLGRHKRFAYTPGAAANSIRPRSTSSPPTSASRRSSSDRQDGFRLTLTWSWLTVCVFRMRKRWLALNPQH